MSKNTRKLRKIAICGLMAAFVFVATQIRIPTAIGYINLGDAVILISAFLLGPIAFIPAAVGSALSDLIAGYAQYIIPTFLIKGLMGLTAGAYLSRVKITAVKKVLIGVIAEIIMIAGYFIFESLPFMYGWQAAAGSLFFNMIQGVAAVVIFVPVTSIPAIKRNSVI